jgi:DNA-binding XRE family transcriptional regulator
MSKKIKHKNMYRFFGGKGNYRRSVVDNKIGKRTAENVCLEWSKFIGCHKQTVYCWITGKYLPEQRYHKKIGELFSVTTMSVFNVWRKDIIARRNNKESDFSIDDPIEVDTNAKQQMKELLFSILELNAEDRKMLLQTVENFATK